MNAKVTILEKFLQKMEPPGGPIYTMVYEIIRNIIWRWYLTSSCYHVIIIRIILSSYIFDKFPLKSIGLCGFPWLDHIRSWNQHTIQTNVVYICELSSHNLSCEGDIRTHPFSEEFAGENISSNSQVTEIEGLSVKSDNKPNLFTAVLMFS